MKFKRLIILASLCLPMGAVQAQADDNDDFGVWTEISVKKELTQTKMKELLLKQAELSKRGNRVISVAIREGTELLVGKMTFLCFVSLKDKIRREAPHAISEVTDAGVGVVMITGDVGDVTAAVQAGANYAASLSTLSSYTVIAAPHEELWKQM